MLPKVRGTGHSQPSPLDGGGDGGGKGPVRVCGYQCVAGDGEGLGKVLDPVQPKPPAPPPLPTFTSFYVPPPSPPKPAYAATTPPKPENG